MSSGGGRIIEIINCFFQFFLLKSLTTLVSVVTAALDAAHVGKECRAGQLQWQFLAALCCELPVPLHWWTAAGTSDEMQTYSSNTSFSVHCTLLRSALFFTSVRSTLTDAHSFFILQSHWQATVILKWEKHFFSMVLFPDMVSVILHSLAFLAFWTRKFLISFSAAVALLSYCCIFFLGPVLDKKKAALLAFQFVSKHKMFLSL